MGSPFSHSLPVLSRDKIRNAVPSKDHQLRCFEQKYTFSETFQYRQEQSLPGAAVLHFDIQSHYPSLYIHAVTWALTTKVRAKQMFRKEIPKDSAYNIASQIEGAVKYCQDQETKGIAIGNDVSLIVSEIILSEVDKYIESELRNIPSYIGSVRFVDDYWITFSNYDTAHASKQIIESLLSPFHLILNESKIRVDRTPLQISEGWVSSFHEFRFSMSSSFKYKIQLREFTNRVITEYKLNDDERIPRYALQILRPFAGKNSLDNISPFAHSKLAWKEYETSIALILQLDRRNIDIVHDIIVFYEYLEGPVEVRGILKTILGYLSSCEIGHCYEIAWSIWILYVRYEDIRGDYKIINYLEKSLTRIIKTDSQVIILMILMLSNNKRCFSRKFARDLNDRVWQILGIRKGTEKQDLEKALYGCFWLLAYSCARKGWARLKPSHLDSFFSKMHKDGVRIFDPEYHLSHEEYMFGTSPRGWGGFKDYDVNERLRRNQS